MAETTRLELATSGVTGRRSNQLNYVSAYRLTTVNTISENRADGQSLGLTNNKINGVPGGTRTPNPLVRSQVLYPIELQEHRQGRA